MRQCVSNSHSIGKSWNNPVEALKSLGLLDEDCGSNKEKTNSKHSEQNKRVSSSCQKETSISLYDVDSPTLRLYLRSYPYPPVTGSFFCQPRSKTPYYVKCLKRLQYMRQLHRTFSLGLYANALSISRSTAYRDFYFGITNRILKSTRDGEEYMFIN